LAQRQDVAISGNIKEGDIYQKIHGWMFRSGITAWQGYFRELGKGEEKYGDRIRLRVTQRNEKSG